MKCFRCGNWPCDCGHTLILGDCLAVLRELPAESINCCVTSPPYWGLRDYGVDGQVGLEATPDEYVAMMVDVFREVRRVLAADGTVWLNLGDCYCTTPRGNREGDLSTSSLTNPQRQDKLWGKHKYRAQDREPRVCRIDGLKPKDLVGIPWRVAFALQADGWWLRQDIVWHKTNPMPESVTDRCTKSHEYIFLLAKSERYYFASGAIAEPSTGRERFGNWIQRQPCPDRNDNGRQDMTPTAERNKRSVWSVTTKPYKAAHFATFPPDLIKPCILAGCPTDGVVLDPFVGSGTTSMVAKICNCRSIGIELNPEYIQLAANRLRQEVLQFTD